MKFAEYLAENLVPEWKEKYLDYKEGKKRIKKVNANSPLTFARNLANATPGFPGSRRFSEFAFKNRKDDGGSFELPPAAIDPEQEEGRSNDSEIAPTEESANDTTPLLSSIRNTSLRTHPSVYQRQSLVGNIDEGSPLQRAMTARSGANFRSAGDNDSLPSEIVSNKGKKEFIEWLDDELLEIELFYKQKEDRAVQKFLILQDQLYQLRDHKEKLKANEDNHHTDELLHFGMDEARNKLQKINKYELPSLPKLNLGKVKIKTDEDHIAFPKAQNHHQRDYVPRKKEAVPYYVAKRQIKHAVQEYYRGLELLKSYRMLNRTGFRKLIKKFDKKTKSDISGWYMEKVNSSYFCTSDILDNLIPKVEELFSLYFENGNRKVAVEKLRSNLKEEEFYTSMFFSGIFFGMAIPLITYALYLGFHKTISKEMPEGKHLLQLWGGFFLLLFMASLVSLNCYIWTKYKINYKFIYEFNPKSALNYRQSFFLPSLLLFALSISMWFSFNDFWPDRLPGRDWPWFFFGFAIILMFCPFHILFYESRRWLLITMWRLIFSGFYPVEFRDFSLGDIFCSLSYTMGNISFFFCMYATHWDGALQGNQSPRCGSSKSRTMGFFASLPPIWRFLQCLRRYADSGDWFPHLANMVKYGVTIVYYLLLSVYRINRDRQCRMVFIFFATINSLYSGIWDILMDWSLIQNKQLLRDDLTYHKSAYYFAIVSDIILRFQWVFYALFSTQVQQSAVTSFFIGIAEVFRRFVWLAIRMENEHVANRHMYRASRELPLPYNIGKRSGTSVRYAGSEEDDQSLRSTRLADEEFNIGYESIEAQAQPPSSTLTKRRQSVLSPEVLRHVTQAIVNAHAKDFQRRKPKEGDSPEDNASSDDDDENSGEE